MSKIVLNDEQRAAVDSTCRIVVLQACPGSGKTRTLAAAVEGSTSGEWALCLTFTRRAAGELRDRLGHVGRTYIGTLHSWCYEVMRQHAHALGYRDERILVLDRDLQRKYVEEVVAGMVKAPTVAAVLSGLNLYGADHPNYHSLDKRVWQAIDLYRQKLRQDNATDYGILIREVAALFAADQNIARQHASQYARILVDEVQDLDPAQWGLIYSLLDASPKLRLFVVGDNDQMCYAWRGASEDAILELRKRYFNGEDGWYELNQNYRSGRKIVDAAQRLIADQTWRASTMRAVTDAPGLTRTVPLHRLAETVRDARLAPVFDPRATSLPNIGCLARTNEGVLEMCEHLKAGGLEVERVAPRTHNDDTWAIMAYLLWWELPYWKAAADTVMAMEGIGEIGRREVWAAAESEAQPALAVACSKHHGLAELYREWHVPEWSLSDRLMMVGGQTKARIGHMPDAYLRITQAFAEYAAETAYAKRTAYGLWASMADHEPTRSTKPLQAMTIHASKGLEFDIVVIGRMGSMRRSTLGESRDERRLLYVAATRAREQLWILDTGEQNPLVGELLAHMENSRADERRDNGGSDRPGAVPAGA